MEEKLDLLSVAYAWIIFTGFSIVPLSVMAQKYQIFESYDSTFFPLLWRNQPLNIQKNES